LENTAYALDSKTIDLRLSVFPWALFRTSKSAVKMLTLLDLRSNIVSFIYISDGKPGDVKVIDILVLEPGAFDVVAECANLLAAGYRPEAIARCLRPPIGADSTESIHSIFCKRSNKALRQNCCAFPACLTNVACEKPSPSTS